MIGEYGAFEFALRDKYRFERKLGSGAMATVYLACDLRLGERVAIKILRTEVSTEHGARRFASEIRIMAGLRHPNIIRVRHADEVDGRLYFVMDYHDGESLREFLTREDQLPVDRAIRIACEIAGALQCAHDHGVVHRDIKPENVILIDGQACVTDFGLALALAGEGERLTASGQPVGTPLYMSPEQANAERVVGPAADQYALACVSYEMLTGLPPFSAASPAATAMMHVSVPPAPLSRWRSGISRDVESAVLRGLAKLPEDRFASVGEFATALKGRSGESRKDHGATRRSSIRGLFAKWMRGSSSTPDHEALTDRRGS